MTAPKYSVVRKDGIVHAYYEAYSFVVREDGGLVIEPFEGAPIAAFAPGVWAMVLSDVEPTKIMRGNPEAAAAVVALAEEVRT